MNNSNTSAPSMPANCIGCSGSPGTPGLSSIQGTSGTTSIQGTSGTTSIQGTPGLGLTGLTSLSGFTGLSGTTGFPGVSSKKCCYCDKKGCYSNSNTQKYLNKQQKHIQEAIEFYKKKGKINTLVSRVRKRIGYKDDVFERLFDCMPTFFEWEGNTWEAAEKELRHVSSCSVEDVLLYVNAECPVILAVAKYRLQNNV